MQQRKHEMLGGRVREDFETRRSDTMPIVEMCTFCSFVRDLEVGV